MIRVENIHGMTGMGNVQRFLIDREWPKEIVRCIPHKEKSGGARPAPAPVDWRPELAPSAALWKWFHHDPEKIDQFRNRYFRELQGKKENWFAIARDAEKGEVTLLYHGKQAFLTPAQFLKEFLEIQLKSHRVPKPAHEKRGSSPGQGVAPPVEKAISRKHELPLRLETLFKPKEKQTFVPADKRRKL